MKRHTVILGAGATMAAIPNGDRNGRKSSVMSGLIEKLDLHEVLNGIKLKTLSSNLEDIYSELHSRPECRRATEELEKRLYQYFEALELPDEPTVYDLLILSLTKKDAIATFNWDPLLLQAYVRCNRITNNLPYILCLHGNVAMGYCEKDGEYGIKDINCPVCMTRFAPTKLLYPVAQKDYESDTYIHNCWEAVQQLIDESYMITIFGYSAPSSDKSAVDLLKRAWGDPQKRQLEEISIIDIVDEEEILIKWRDFIHTHHYQYTKDFYSSYLGLFPRRSCEMVFAMFCLNICADNTKGFHKGMSWSEVEEQIYDLICEEQNTAKNENYPIHYAAVYR